MRFRFWLASAGALTALGMGVASCSDLTSETDHAVVTSVAVDPSEFLGDLPCSPNPGAVLAYTAEVVDLDSGVSVATSPPVSCTLPVAFEQVEEDHRYFARIRVFDLPPESVDASTPPSHETTCGEVEGFAIVNADERAFIHGCGELSSKGSTTTSIEIDTKTLVAPLGCVAEGGKIDSLRVTAIDPPAGSLPDVVIACGQGPVGYASGLTPSAIYRFEVRAFVPGVPEAAWVSKCSASTKDGIRVDAACTPLSTYGTIEIDVAAVLPTLHFPRECGTGEDQVASYDVAFDTGMPGELAAHGIACETNAVVGPVASGTHGGEVTFRNTDGKRIDHAICFVDALPGVTVTAPCVAD